MMSNMMSNPTTGAEGLYCMKPGDAITESLFNVLTRVRAQSDMSSELGSSLNLSQSAMDQHNNDAGESDEPQGSTYTAARRALPGGALDVSTSALIHRILENDMENQSILYRWTTSKIMVPTVSYMGRKLRADGTGESVQAQAAKDPMDQSSQSAGGIRRGASFDNSNNNYSDDSVSESEEFQEYIKDLSSSDFAQLKQKLKRERTLTGLCNRDALYTVAQVQKNRPAGVAEPPKVGQEEEQQQEQEPIKIQTKWEKQLAYHPSLENAVDSNNLPSCTECIHCALAHGRKYIHTTGSVAKSA